MRQITRDFAASLREAVPAVLSEWAKRNGVVVTASGRTSFTTRNAVLTLQVSAIDDATGVAQTQEVQAYERMCASQGFPSGICGKPFTVAGKAYEIVGWNSRAKAYPLIYRDVDSGKTFKAHLNGAVALHLRKMLKQQAQGDAEGAPSSTPPVEDAFSTTELDEKWG